MFMETDKFLKKNSNDELRDGRLEAIMRSPSVIALLGDKNFKI